MTKAWAIILVLLLALAWACNKQDEEVLEEPAFALKDCPVARVRLTPEKFSDPALAVHSGQSVDLVAEARGPNGEIMAVPELTWSLRYPDSDSEQSSGAGHTLTVVTNAQARFTASGLAPGVFTVVAQDKSCNLAGDDRPQYPEGQAWITVADEPGAEASCGRLKVTFGDRIDRVGDEVVASSKVTLMAQIFARQKLGRDYRVQFYIDEKPYPGKRPVYRDNEAAKGNMEIGHLSLLPLYLTPGQHRVRYELLERGQARCGSRVERFSAR